MSRITALKSKLVDSLTSLPPFAKYIGNKWFARWERGYALAEKELSDVPSLVKPGSVFFDIGANRGELAYFFATECRASQVYAFEPQRRMWNVLSGVASKQNNIIPLHIALSDSPGEKTIHIPVKTTGRYTQAASLEATEADSEGKGKSLADEQVHVDTLDGFVAKNNIRKIDFIKCDTEGHELSVFKGGRKTLQTLKPVVYVEIKKQNEAELFGLFKNLGYSMHNPQGAQSENYYFYPPQNAF